MYAIISLEGQVNEYARLHDATRKADQLAQGGAEVLVKHLETDAVVYTVNPQALAPGYFTPWTRVETPKFVAPALAGWTPAYTRKRIQATVYRRLAGKGWLVHDGRTGGTQEVADTKEACALTKAMRLGQHLEA
jgi:hypothetical protein